MYCYRALLYMEINIVLKWPRPSRPLNSFTLITDTTLYITYICYLNCRKISQRMMGTPSLVANSNIPQKASFDCPHWRVWK